MTIPDLDLEGFREAQITLRERFSQDVTFRRYDDGTYGPEIAIDPESGVPYDPMASAIASGVTEIPASAEVFRGHRASDTEADEVATAIGEIETGQAVLAIDPADLAEIQGATEVVVDGEVYRVSNNVDERSIGPLAADRTLIWVEQE